VALEHFYVAEQGKSFIDEEKTGDAKWVVLTDETIDFPYLSLYVVRFVLSSLL